jgi:glycosyltransferase involved in cell wall biosynthesis
MRNAATIALAHMQAKLVSILVPLYNEEEYVGALLERVLAAPLGEGLEREIVVVDDGSRDGSAEVVEALAAAEPRIRLIRHERNQGKGAAIRTAVEQARGEFAIIQDADLEYDPAEYGKLLRPLLDGRADAVYGSRFLAAGERRVLYFWHSIANHLLTGLCNLVADLNLTDMETCYKAFRTPLVKSIPIRSNRFGIEPELTIKLARRQARIYETPISYHGRTYEEGKKIGVKDAAEAVWVILRYAFTRDLYRAGDAGILDAFAGTPRFNRWMAETIAPYVGNRVLEIGAGIGNLTRLLAPRRKLYVAGDIDGEHLERLRTRFQHRPNLRVCRCDLGEAGDFEPFRGQMDTVVCLNVLEHIEDDRQGLRNMHDALRPGGAAVILVPHDRRAYGTLDEVLGHHRRYEREELRARMEEAGFTVERLMDFNRVSYPAWRWKGQVWKRRTISRPQLRLFDSLVWLWRAVDGRLPWPAASIIAVGRKR